MRPQRALIKDNDDLFEATCIVTSGSPRPAITWKFPDNATLNNVRTDNGKLIISKPVVGNSGYYKCFARNSQGTAISSLLVYVRRKYFDNFNRTSEL